MSNSIKALQAHPTFQLKICPPLSQITSYTVGRVVKVFTDQQNDLWLFDEQLRRWKAGQLTARQREEVERLVGQMAKLRQVITDILHLANELKEETIEKQLAKSDEQLGLEFLLRHLPKQ